MQRSTRYGATLEFDELSPSPLPPARGALTAWLFDHLRRVPHALGTAPDFDDALFGEDGALALYCLYELHYRGFLDVSDDWEWEPTLLAVRQRLEADLEHRLTALAGPMPDIADVAAELRRITTSGGGPSLSAYLMVDGTREQLIDFMVLRTAFQLKEADPFTWAIPRLAGEPKAAMVEIQKGEYGDGVEADMHQNLYGVTLRGMGLDTRYNGYLPQIPAIGLATVNVMSFFGLHRRLRGALVGHLSLFEMCSVEPMGKTSVAMRRLGFDADARHFFEVHVVADAHHAHVAADGLAGGLARQEPALAKDIVFGAVAGNAVECEMARRVIAAWRQGESVLLPAPAEAAATA